MTKIQPRNSCYSCLPETSPRKLPIASCAIQVVDETDKAFQIDALGLRDEVLRKCASAAKTAETHVAVANGAADAAEMAVAKDNFPAAITLIDLAIAESRKAKDDSTVKRLSERGAEIDAIAQAFSAVKKSARDSGVESYRSRCESACGQIRLLCEVRLGTWSADVGAWK